MGHVMEINTQCPLCKSDIKCLRSLYKQTEICSPEQLTVAQMSPKFAHTQSFLPAKNGDLQTIGLYEVKFNVECYTCGLVFVVPFVIGQTTSTLQVTYIKDDNGDSQPPIIDRDDIPRQLIDEYHWSELNRLESEED